MKFNPETTELLHKSIQTVPAITCGKTLKSDIDDLVAMIFPEKKLAVVDDRNTAQALGEQVFRALKGRFACAHVTLPGTPIADYNTVEYMRRETAASDALVAVGSGTLNDLCKYASFTDGKPYLVFPTAASMNGYLSANASITKDGYKKTLPAHMPQAVFCDLAVIAAAPPRLNKSGLGDALARSTAQADWLLSHLLLGTPYDDTPFTLLKPIEPHLFETARGIGRGDTASVELLMQTLLLSGLGMTIAHGSYPASQGEHMIAHAYEMIRHPGPETFHGEQIGVTTLIMAHRQEKLLRHHLHFDIPPFPVEKIESLFGDKITQEAQKAYHLKLETIRRANVEAGMLKAKWPYITGRIEAIRIAPEKIRAVLKAADAPDLPQSLGWHATDFVKAANHARFLRDRFTFLDVE